jgi:predicted Zn-dependent protease
MKKTLKSLIVALGFSLCVGLAQGLPEKVPDGKTPTEYYDMAQAYKRSGWTEQARDALNRSIKGDPGGVGRQARVYLDCYIPRYPVVPEAVQLNIAGYNQMAGGDFKAAEATFKDCIRRYPKFEWPYGNLGMVYTQLGQLKEARQVLQKALDINPSYVNGWVHLAEACLKDNDKAGAKSAVSQALRCDPGSSQARKVQTQIGP